MLILLLCCRLEEERTKLQIISHLFMEVRVCYNPSAMSKYITPIDISNVPVLGRIVEEMKHTKQPRLLKEDSKAVAI